MKITILGTGSATPSLLRNPSAQIISDFHENYLVDCGEGTQYQISRNNIKLNKLKNIFISHLHGDHYFGLIGLISSLNLSHRKDPLTIYGPRGLDEIITVQLKYSNTILHFSLNFVSLDPTESNQIINNDFISITTIPLEHRIPCCGFLFYEKPMKRNIIKSKLPSEISIEEIIALKSGRNILNNDDTIKYNYEELTFEQSKGVKYAYCSDTAYSEKIVDFIFEANLLYHEATFKKDLFERANTTFHSTAEEAGKIAKLANVQKLLIGHFSSRYHDLNENLEEAKAIFENTEIAIEGKTYLV